MYINGDSIRVPVYFEKNKQEIALGQNRLQNDSKCLDQKTTTNKKNKTENSCISIIHKNVQNLNSAKKKKW